MGRKQNMIENRRGERQHKPKNDWMTHEKFFTMYDCVYAAMVDEKVDTPMDKSD